MLNKRITTSVLVMTLMLSPIQTKAFDMNDWYSDYMNEEYIKLTKFNELYTISDKYNVDINDIEEIEFKVTAYSSLPEENGGYTITCNGEPLKGNILANNTIPQGTKVILDGVEYEIADRGSSRFNKRNRVDMLIERLPNESVDEYRKRVSDFGVKHIKGYIINK